MSKLIMKLRDLRLNSIFCLWILNILVARWVAPQPPHQHWDLSGLHLLLTPLFPVCASPCGLTQLRHIIKCDANTTIIIIPNMDETEHREEIEPWRTTSCKNNFQLSKTQEHDVDYRRQQVEAMLT